MSWQLSDNTDQAVRRWMATKGWEVTRINYDFTREIYAWRHDVRGKPSPTLRISRKVLDNIVNERDLREGVSKLAALGTGGQ